VSGTFSLRVECKPSLTISAKPDGVGAVSQVRITRGRQFWVVAAEREDAGRFIVRADEKLTAFTELQRTIREFAVDLIS
jgi:hypothetical protein